MREWLSGGVSPCQGEGRGFESRLALEEKGIDQKIDSLQTVDKAAFRIFLDVAFLSY